MSFTILQSSQLDVTNGKARQRIITQTLSQITINLFSVLFTQPLTINALMFYGSICPRELKLFVLPIEDKGNN